MSSFFGKSGAHVLYKKRGTTEASGFWTRRRKIEKRKGSRHVANGEDGVGRGDDVNLDGEDRTRGKRKIAPPALRVDRE